jgi:hypothetical protein
MGGGKMNFIPLTVIPENGVAQRSHLSGTQLSESQRVEPQLGSMSRLRCASACME